MGEEIAFDDGVNWLKGKVLSPLCDKVKGGFESGPWFTITDYGAGFAKCYDMCIQRANNHASKLYSLHESTIRGFLESFVLPSLEAKAEEALLKEVSLRWERHLIMNKWLRKFFGYLDRYYTPQNNLPKLQASGLHQFREYVFVKVKSRTTRIIVEFIDKERSGEIVNRPLLSKCVEVYATLSDIDVTPSSSMEAKDQTLYDEFEVEVLDRASAYYARKASEWVESDGTPEYMLKAEQALQKEDDRVNHYLQKDTKPKLKATCVKELLEKYEKALLEKEGSGCRALLRDGKRADLRRMFQLFHLVEGGLEPMAKILSEYVKEIGEGIVAERKAGIDKGEKDSAQNPAFVRSLIALHDKYVELIKSQFDGHSLFTKAVQSAFEVFINHDVGKRSNSEMLSTYCDRILRGGGGSKMSEEEIEAQLSKVVDIFAYLSDKDIFSEIYRNQLAKRILNGRSTSDEAERSMISKLKLKCGAQFTSKMEGMVNDLKMGHEKKKIFAEYYNQKVKASNGPRSMNFSVDVLSTGHWPSYEKVEVSLPSSMSSCVEMFTDHFKKSNDHKVLSWVHSLGNMTIRAKFKRSYTLRLTTLQGIALLLFNSQEDGAFISFADMKTALNVDDEIVKRVMHSLTCGKYKLLSKQQDSRGISRDDAFRINKKFVSKKLNITVPMASLEASHKPKKVAKNREIAVEAGIVRIMKARKRLKHHELVSEVLTQLHFFQPQPKMVKRRIEALIEREYLERDENNSKVYKYLA